MPDRPTEKWQFSYEPRKVRRWMPNELKRLRAAQAERHIAETHA